MDLSARLNTKRFRRNRSIFRTERSAFRTSGYVGLVCALGVSTFLATRLGLSRWTTLGILVIAISIFLGRCLFSRFVGRPHQLVFYRYFITLVGVAVSVSWLSG